MMANVLIADAHELMREGVKSILGRSERYNVAGEAANAAGTLALVRATPAQALIVDPAMPGRDGIDLIKAVAEAQAGLRILVLTMHGDQQYAVRAFKAGAAGFLTKETASAELLFAVSKVVAGGAYVSLSIAEQYAQSLQQFGDSLPHQRLSDREFDVFRHICAGHTVTGIAKELSLSAKTVSTYKARILEKMLMPHEAALVRYALKHKLFEDES